jgi:peptide/nickel transport system substrate-binding protein
LNPIGTGPYQKEDLFASRGQFAISLRVAPAYRERPEGQSGYAIDRIVFRTYPTLDQAIDAFARGEVNSIGDVPPDRLESLNSLNFSAKTTFEPTVGVLIFNWQRDGIRYVQNQRARLAFARGIDRVNAVQSAMGGVALPAESPLIPRSWAYNANAHFPTYDLQLARSTLEGVSFENVVSESTDESDSETPTEDVTDEEITEDAAETTEDTGEEAATVSEPIRRDLTILVLDEPRKVALAQIIADQWSQLDFEVTVEPADLATYRQRLADGDFDSAIVEYSYEPYADPDPYAFWHVSQYEDGSNYGGMRDLRISEVIEQARRETVGINRKIWYDDFQRLFVTRVPALTLYHPLYSYVVDGQLVNVQLGFISSPADRFRTIQNWTWELE